MLLGNSKVLIIVIKFESYFFFPHGMLVPYRTPPQAEDRGTDCRYEWYLGNQIPGVDQKPDRGRNPEFKPIMMCDNSMEISQVGKPIKVTPSVGSNQVKALAAMVGCTHFGGDQTHGYFNKDL